MITGKRGGTTILTESLVRLVVAIILLVVVIAIAAQLLSVKDTTATDRFFDLVDLIDDIGREQPGAFADLTLVMDKESAIIGFARNAGEVSFERTSFRPDGSKFIKANSVFPRPQSSECGDEGACLCLCQEFTTDADPGRDSHAELRCAGKLICKVLSTELPVAPFLSQFKLTFPDPDYNYYYTGGFYFKGFGQEPTSRYVPAVPRRSLIFVEKGKGDLVGLCFEEPPCFTNIPTS
jgi:hypothetical protein